MLKKAREDYGTLSPGFGEAPRNSAKSGSHATIFPSRSELFFSPFLFSLFFFWSSFA